MRALVGRLRLRLRPGTAGKAVLTGLLNGVAVLAVCAAALDHTVWAFVLGGVVLGATAVGLRHRPRSLRHLGSWGAARTLTAVAAVVLVARSDLPEWTVLIGATLAAIVATEPSGARLWRAAGRPVLNLPGFDLDRPYVRSGGLVVAASVALIALTAFGTLWTPVAAVAAVGTAVDTAVIAAWTLHAVRDRSRLGDAVATALEDYAPQVMLYLSGPAGTEYQLRTWLEHIDAVDRRHVVVVREAPLAQAVARLTDAPVVAAGTLQELDRVQVPSLRVALYVNNGAKNSHNVRYRDLVHVQLLHGDSDKPSSFNPVAAMFDAIFVAGQAGVDRYALHGIAIPASKFRIVGRPQVQDIARAAGDRREHVLYAPTWTGFHADNSFGSLAHGTLLVGELLAAGWTVTFRPHPYSIADAASRQHIADVHAMLDADTARTGRAHVYGEAASALDLVESFNASDALVADVSSVPADYLFSEKPFVLARMGTADDATFLAEFPLARAAYVAHADDRAEVAAAVARLKVDDMAGVRAELRRYYLGDFPVEGYGQVFVDAVRDLVDAPRDDGHEATDDDELEAHAFEAELADDEV
ncbi:CDP-glycerol glycerophosphotransferase family protein [Cellulomonas sp. PhB150]|uniref:CDP-glycerol glycerophosphotransferase family protein n=1 Tax=Cellulomonas sp. PhB150 TaxID=2485188 RepID=UPI000F4AC473|nr:CDP-glycerol glycerophosphotransferase family protein [Cellulomonas sp. PhB150]ROS31213.1 CDP-glycerol:poly(glycerophosphate) glycerophosphotransferase [Cellulomonas sp. PhB150]